MSIHIATLDGKKEIPLLDSLNYIRKQIHITAFYGGIDRGVSLQITLDEDFIQLDNQNAKALIKALQEAFPD